TIAVIVGLQFGIWGLLTAQVVSSYVALFINMYYTRRFIDYSITEQLRDVGEILIYSLPMAIVVWLAGMLTPGMITGRLVIMIVSGIVSYLLIGILTGAEPIRIAGNVLSGHIPALQRTIS